MKTTGMKAIILAAGKGSRMGRLTSSIPKTLVVVRGKPILDHIFDSLPKEVTDVIVVVGYRGDTIKKHLGTRYTGRAVHYVTQTVFDGPARAVLLTRDFFTHPDERFFIIHGDELPSSQNMRDCLSHRYSWLCHPLTHSIPTGRVRLDAHGRIIGVREERFGCTPPCLSDGGVILVSARLFACKPRRHLRTREWYLTSMVNQFLKKFPVYAVMGEPDLYLSTPADVDRVNRNM
ncbi:MAG: hypothetical protein EXS51_00565 [Candidatus Taylorbacteria bacterium]|nr:hypothetical protein [Candidatus Taylorbacteria bacterium]